MQKNPGYPIIGSFNYITNNLIIHTTNLINTNTIPNIEDVMSKEEVEKNIDEIMTNIADQMLSPEYGDVAFKRFTDLIFRMTGHVINLDEEDEWDNEDSDEEDEGKF